MGKLYKSQLNLEKAILNLESQKKELEEIAKRPMRIYFKFYSELMDIAKNIRNKDIDYDEKTNLLIRQISQLLIRYKEILKNE